MQNKRPESVHESPFPVLGLSLTLASTVFFLHGGSRPPRTLTLSYLKFLSCALRLLVPCESIFRLETLESYDSQKVKSEERCTRYKGSLIPTSSVRQAALGPLSVSWRPVAERHLCWIPLGVCGRYFGTS